MNFLTAALLFISLLLTPQPALAQTTSPKPSPSPLPNLVAPGNAPSQGINLSISPPFANLTTDPGSSVTGQFKIRNNNNFREYLKLSLAKFKASETGDSPALQLIEKDDEFAKWISFSEDKFLVDINEQKTIKFTLSPPKDASLGYYYAIIVERLKNDEAPGGGAVISGAPAFLLILEVRSPNAKKELKLINFTTDSPVYEYLPVKFNIKFKNTGNIHLVPSGDIFIDWGNQKEIDIIRANQTRGNILPGTERTYNAYWDNGFIAKLPKVENGQIIRDKKGDIVYETKWDFSKITKFRIGLYTAHLLAIYDNGQRDIPLEATVSFWIIPWKILLTILTVIILVLIGVKSTFSSVFSKVKRR